VKTVSDRQRIPLRCHDDADTESQVKSQVALRFMTQVDTALHHKSNLYLNFIAAAVGHQHQYYQYQQHRPVFGDAQQQLQSQSQLHQQQHRHQHQYMHRHSTAAEYDFNTIGAVSNGSSNFKAASRPSTSMSPPPPAGTLSEDDYFLSISKDGTIIKPIPVSEL
jgi:hypothetical protein